MYVIVFTAFDSNEEPHEINVGYATRDDFLEDQDDNFIGAIEKISDYMTYKGYGYNGDDIEVSDEIGEDDEYDVRV